MRSSVATVIAAVVVSSAANAADLRNVLEGYTIASWGRADGLQITHVRALAQVHVKNILNKLDVKDRTAAVNVALRRGIIHIPQSSSG